MTVYRYFKNLNDNTPLSPRLLHTLPRRYLTVHPVRLFLHNKYIYLLVFVYCRTPGNSIRFIYILTCFFFAIYRVYRYIYLLGIWVLCQTITYDPFVAWKYIINIVYIVHNIYIIHVYTPSLLHRNSPRVDLYADHRDY